MTKKCKHQFYIPSFIRFLIVKLREGSLTALVVVLLEHVRHEELWLGWLCDLERGGGDQEVEQQQRAQQQEGRSVVLRPAPRAGVHQVTCNSEETHIKIIIKVGMLRPIFAVMLIAWFVECIEV